MRKFTLPAALVSLFTHQAHGNAPQQLDAVNEGREIVTVDQLKTSGALVWDKKLKQWVVDLKALEIYLKTNGPTVFDSHEVYVREANRSGSNW